MLFRSLLDLEDVYWKAEGRESVDFAIGLIAAGGTIVAGMPFWPHAHRVLRDLRNERLSRR